MKLHEAKLLLNDPTFSIDSITYQELEMDSDYVDVHEDISYSKDNVDLHSHTFFEILFFFLRSVFIFVDHCLQCLEYFLLFSGHIGFFVR